MEFNHSFDDASQTLFKRSQQRSKTADRITNESEVEVIRSQIGDLEDIRHRLGLSARKMAQLLMVDPSAWSRWSKRITPPPPHIYRALQWYLILQEKNPGFTPQIFLAHRWHARSAKSEENSHEFSLQINELKQKIDDLESIEKKRVTINSKEMDKNASDYLKFGEERKKDFYFNNTTELTTLNSSKKQSKLKLVGPILIGMILGIILARAF